MAAAQRRSRRVPATLTLALLLVAGPASAQTEPYPPGEPEEPDPAIECELRARPDGVRVICSGQGLDPDADIETEVRDGGGVLGSESSDVDADGTGRAVVDLGCDQLSGDTLEVTGTSQGPDGTTVVGRTSGDPEHFCPASVGGTGEQTGDETGDQTAGDQTGDERGSSGGLAFTGQDIGLLVAIALLLLLAGFGLTRNRRRQPA